MVVVKFLVPSDKTVSGVEVLRWSLKDCKQDLDVDNIKKRLRNYYKDDKADFLLSWFDGTDDCSIHSNADLTDLYDYTQNQNSNCDEIRINVKVIESCLRPANNSKQEDVMTEIPDPSESQEEYEFVEQPNVQQRESNSSIEQPDEPKSEPVSQTAPVPEPDPKPNNETETTKPSEAQAENQGLIFPNAIPWGMPGQMPNPVAPMMPYPMYCAPQMGGPWTQYPYQPMYMTQYPASATEQQPPQSQQQQQLYHQQQQQQHQQQQPQPAELPRYGSTSVTRLEQVEASAIRSKPSVASCPAKPGPTTSTPNKKQLKKSHSKHSHSRMDQESMEKIISQIRAMGFDQDDRTLKRLIVKSNGDINKVLDKLR